jgi:two-component system OmpR family response regulator
VSSAKTYWIAPPPPHIDCLEVLVLEQDPVLGAAVCDALRGEGYRVRWMDDGRLALAYLQARLYERIPLPAVLIADVDLPGVAGIDVAASLRQAGQTTTVILVASDCSEDVRARAREVEALAIFEKPLYVAGICDFIAVEIEGQ